MASCLDFSGATTYHAPPTSHVLPFAGYTWLTQTYVYPQVKSNMPYEIWERFKPAGAATYGDWAKVAYGYPAQWGLTLPMAQGDGQYDFCSIAFDPVTGEREAKALVPEATLGLDMTPPHSVLDLPARTTQASINVPYTVSDGAGSGVASAQLIYRYRANQDAPWGDWEGLAFDLGPAPSGEVAAPFDHGEGFYQFHTNSWDVVGNHESRTVPDPVVHYTTGGEPSSSALSLPTFTGSTTITVPYTVEFASGGGSVDLYERFQAKGGSTYAPWAKVSSTTAPDPLTAPLLLGGGRYEFYTVAIDGQSGVSEPYPASADAFVTLDATPPTSTIVWSQAIVNSPDGYSIEETSSDDATGISRVQIFYQYEPVGGLSFGAWKQVGEANQCSGNLLTDCTVQVRLAEGDGTYNLASVATDGVGNVEAGPSTAEVSTVLDTVAPTSSAGPLAPAVKAGSISVSYAAADNAGGSGINTSQSVVLYRRFLAAGSTTWTDWSPYKTATSSPVSVSLDLGYGRYEFYTVAFDNAWNREADHAAADTFTIYDKTAPTSNAGALTSPTMASTVDVPYTAGDVNGSGVATVDLYRRFTAPNGNPGSYSKVATVTSGSSAGTFAAVPLSSDGTYDFYTRATDVAGNVEAAPSLPDATIVRSLAAASNVASSIALIQKASPLTVPWVVTATGGGIASVELWYRYTAPGATPSGSYSKATTYTGSATSGTLNYTASSDGLYELYTIAVTSGGTREAAPPLAAPDASVILDRVGPTSTTTALTSPTKAPTVDISYSAADTNGSGLASVELWQRYTLPGGTPSGSYALLATNPGTTSPQKFAGVALAADGRYEFYTIAVDKAGNRKATPSAETFIVRDTAAPNSSAVAPATTAATSVNVTYTINDGGGSGPVSIQLFERYAAPGGTPSGSYAPLTTINSTATSGTFSNVATASDGTYEFYTLATDAAGNVEVAPATADSTTVRSATPISNVASTIAAFQKAVPLAVPWVVTSNGGGLSSLELWERFTLPGAQPSGTFSKVATLSSPAASGTFSWTPTTGDGLYEFYTLAVTTGSIREVVPSVADGSTVLDRVVPTASTTALTSPTKGSAVDISYTASDNANGSGLASVELWQRYTIPGGTPSGSYTLILTNPGTASPQKFTGVALAADGRYEFYTIAVDKAGNRKATPSAETFIVRDTAAPTSSLTAAAATSAATINITYTINDGGGSGPVSIQLFERYTVPGGTPSGSYTSVTTITSTATSGTFSNVALTADGRYEFYALAVDAAGNTEAVPGSAKATTIRDQVLPTSAAGTLAALINGAALSVPYTASDGNGSGLAKVDLYYRWTTPGGTPSGSYTKLATATPGAASGTFSVTLGSGAGNYQFVASPTQVYLGWRDDTAGGGDIRIRLRNPS